MVLTRSGTTRSLKRFLSTQAQLKVSDDYQTALPYNEIPRPTNLKFLRDFMPGGEFHNSSITDYASETHKRFGDIVIMPGMFARADTVMIFNTKDFEKVFRNDGQWPIRPFFETMAHYREHVKGDFFGEVKGLIALQGKDWLKLRSVVNPILMQARNTKVYMKPLFNINQEFIKRIKEVRDAETLEVPADFEEELNRLTFEGISVVALNRELGLIRKNRENSDAVKLFESVRQVMDLMYELDVEPSMWKIVRTPKYYEMMRAQGLIFDLTSKFVDETLKIAAQKQSETLDSQELGAMERLSAVDQKVAVVMAMDMMFAGVDATSSTLAGILLCLAKNPEKQDKLREEIMNILPSKETELNEEKMKNMPYLRAVIKESMRYYPIGPGTLRTSNDDLTLSGYKIPKGTNVLLNLNLLMKDEAYFTQANEFIPERWLRSADNKKLDLDPFAFLPFGFGPRICVGKRIAQLELETTIINLIRHFHVDFNYSVEKPFKMIFFNTPAIPLKFKFTDVKN